MAKTRKKPDNKFEKAVKPYYHPSSDDCFIVYSSKEKLSLDGDFTALQAKNVKKKFGFELLCSDLLKSANEAFDYHKEKKILLKLPKALDYGDTLGALPDSYTNTNELFILHKTTSKMGFGVSSGGNMNKGYVIAEYIGERVTLASNTDSTYYYFNKDNTANIDAKNYGNVARFFNHCPNEHPNEKVLTANVAALEWKVSEKLTKVFFISLREIKAFEPICWDYGDNYNFHQGVELLDANTYFPINDHHDL